MSIDVNTPSQTLAVTTTSARVALPDADFYRNGICIVNTGANPVFIQTGDSTVAAVTNTNVCVQPNWPRVFKKNTAHTHIAAITAASTSTIYITPCSCDEQV